MRRLFRNSAGVGLIEVILAVGVLSIIAPVAYRYIYQEMLEVNSLRLASSLRSIEGSMGAYMTLRRGEWSGNFGRAEDEDDNCPNDSTRSQFEECYGLSPLIPKTITENMKVRWTREIDADTKKGAIKVYALLNLQTFNISEPAMRRALLYCGDNCGMAEMGEGDKPAKLVSSTGAWSTDCTENPLCEGEGVNRITKNTLVVRVDSAALGDDFDENNFLARTGFNGIEGNTMRTCFSLGCRTGDGTTAGCPNAGAPPAAGTCLDINHDINDASDLFARFLSVKPQFGKAEGKTDQNYGCRHSICFVDGTFFGGVNIERHKKDDDTWTGDMVIEKSVELTLRNIIVAGHLNLEGKESTFENITVVDNPSVCPLNKGSDGEQHSSCDTNISVFENPCLGAGICPFDTSKRTELEAQYAAFRDLRLGDRLSVKNLWVPEGYGGKAGDYLPLVIKPASMDQLNVRMGEIDAETLDSKEIQITEGELWISDGSGAGARTDRGKLVVGSDAALNFKTTGNVKSEIGSVITRVQNLMTDVNNLNQRHVEGRRIAIPPELEPTRLTDIKIGG